MSKPKVYIVFMLMFYILTLLIFPNIAYADDSSNWTYNNDGYYYYNNYPILMDINTSFYITSDSDQIELFNYVENKWQIVESNITMTMLPATNYGIGYKALWYLPVGPSNDPNNPVPAEGFITDVLDPTKILPENVIRKTKTGINERDDLIVELSGLSIQTLYPEWNKIVTAAVYPNNFSHWEDKDTGELVSFNNEYKFSALSDRQLVSKNYENINPYTFVRMFEIENYRFESKYKTYLSQYEVYNGDHVLEHGWELNGEKVSGSNPITESTNEFLISINSNNWEMGRAYIKVSNGYNERYIYSDPIIIPYQETQEEIIGNINELPATTNNTLGNVTFNVVEETVNITINYNRVNYHLIKRFTPETDLALFNTIEAYYINVGGNPQIFINHSNRPYLGDILEAPNNEKPAFVPHTVWDLKTDEILTIHNYITHVYVKMNEQGLIMAYMYIDEYVIDNLLSAELSWNVGTKWKFPANLIYGKDIKWQKQEAKFTNDEYTKYIDTSWSWLDMFNPLGIVKDTQDVYEMPSIDSVNFNNIQSGYNITVSELETHFKKVNSDFETLKIDSRYKVWAFAFQPGMDNFGGTTQIYYNYNNLKDPMNLQIIELVYETNGKLYTAVGDDMDLRVSIQEKLDGNNPSTENRWKALALKILPIAMIILWFISMIQVKGFTNLKKFLTTTILIIIAWLVVNYLLVNDYILFYFLRL